METTGFSMFRDKTEAVCLLGNCEDAPFEAPCYLYTCGVVSIGYFPEVGTLIQSEQFWRVLPNSSP